MATSNGRDGYSRGIRGSNSRDRCDGLDYFTAPVDSYKGK